jgi:hypothetical protein
MENKKQEFINCLYELKRYIFKEMHLSEALIKNEYNTLETERIKGRLEMLKFMFTSINEIIDKYLETHVNN